MPFYTGSSYDTYLVPFVKDTSSENLLGDPTGQVACGPRIFKILDNSEVLQINLATKEISLVENTLEGSY